MFTKVSEIEAEGDIETGVNIVLKALTAPVRQIAENAGLEGSVIVERLKMQNQVLDLTLLQTSGLIC